MLCPLRRRASGKKSRRRTTGTMPVQIVSRIGGQRLHQEAALDIVLCRFEIRDTKQ
jgi:hypothetical protein